MKIRWRTVTLSAVLTTFLFLGSAPVSAENLSYTDLADRIQALETELNSQQVKLASCDSTAGCCSTDSRSDCCATPAWYYGYELTILRPIVSEAGAGDSFEDDYGFGHRFVVGYDGGSGMGVRMRYWFYNHNHDVTGGGSSLKIDMDVLDLEVTLEEQLCNWDLLVTGGFRYGRIDLLSSSNEFEFYVGSFSPTVSLEATRDFGDRNLYLIGNCRASLLYGDVTNGGTKTEDEMVTNLENQVGVGYRRDLGRSTLTLRTVWETQFWLSEYLTSNLGSDLGFTGPTISAELRY